MKISKPVFFLAIFIAILAPASKTWAADRQEAFVQEVLSGDTVRLKGGKTLKYAGIEAPPLQHTIPLVRVYGENSKTFNAGLVLNKKIIIDWGRRLRDDRNNLLGYVYLEDGTFVNLALLKSGNAKSHPSAPNLEHAKEFTDAAWIAQKNSLGLWKEQPKNPFLKEEFVGEKNTKIYYLPNSPELDRIPKAQLVPFRSRVEASAAGYRACERCKDAAGGYGESETLY